MAKVSTQNHRIRPAARIIDTLGKGLIKDELAAIIELVKNSYDADSADVIVRFDFDHKKNTLIFSITDHGHGMDTGTVTGKWLVPGTSDKLERKTSPKRYRQLQGRKGIGRYAAGILGQELFLSTTDESGITTELLMDWTNIAQLEFLDEAEILVESGKTGRESGTYIEVRNNLNFLEDKPTVADLWPDKKIERLEGELKKLLTPVAKRSKDKFDITLEIRQLQSKKYDNYETLIEPIPLLDMYDYQVKGSISKAGRVTLIYNNQNLKTVNQEKINFDLKDSEYSSQSGGKFCGKIGFDIRVFDRDKEAIDDLVERADVFGVQLGKRDAKKLINEFNGVGVYRGGFRIRPYGDRDFDWLGLDFRRVQIPATRIGSNQVVAVLDIEEEEKSGLEEKSARDGLVENTSYRMLQERILQVIKVLESKRYEFRVATGRGRKLVNLEEALESLFDFDKVVASVESELKKLKVPNSNAVKVIKSLLDVKEEKARELENIKETIALYQGQATLGKMVGLILHEGRKPVAHFKNRFPKVQQWCDQIIADVENSKAINRLKGDIAELGQSADILSRLFSTLDPFSVKKGERARNSGLLAIVSHAVSIFQSELEAEGIEVSMDIPDSLNIYARPTELTYVFSNLVENSLYWHKQSKIDNRVIAVSASSNNNMVIVKFYDNGPGVPEKLLENSRLFEPGVTLKENGTGLGLSLVGEMVKRNSGEVYARAEDRGVSFIAALPAERGES